MSLLEDYYIRGAFRTGDGITRMSGDVSDLIPDEELPEVARSPGGPINRKWDFLSKDRPRVRKKKSDG